MRIASLTTNALVQVDFLWIADPKAIHHILQGASHLYEKPAFLREMMATFMDRDLYGLRVVRLSYHMRTNTNSELRGYA
jgi:hypothetical protein